jgi:hypothetical protein
LSGLRRCNGGYRETGAAPSRSADRIYALIALEDEEKRAAFESLGFSPTVAQTPDGTIVVAYHEYSDDEEPIQYMRTSRFRLD